jgi:membrane protein
LTALAVTLATSLQHQGVVKWFLKLPGIGNLLLLRLLPCLIIWIVLVCLYLFIPNVRVRFRHAVVGGLIAAATWQVAQWLFMHFQLGVSRYNAIYGTLALLPVFMMWLYTSWIIVLAGMEIVWYLQHKSQMGIRSGTGIGTDISPQMSPPQGLSQD